MASESPSAVQSTPPTEGVELSARRCRSIEGFEILIPEAAEVRVVPAQILPPGISKKMGVPSARRDSCANSVMVTWISPVVVRENGPRLAGALGSHRAPPPSCHDAAAQALVRVAVETSSSAPGGQGQCWLPITCSNRTAFKVLMKHFPHGHRPSSDGERESRQPACQPPLHRDVCFRQDAIIIHRGLVFISINKPRRLAPEAPPTLTQQTPSGVPGGLQSAQPSCSDSALRHNKAGPLRLRFGLKRRERVALACLPEASLKTLKAGRRINLQEHPVARPLCRQAEQEKLDSPSRVGTVEISRNRYAEAFAAAGCSRDTEKVDGSYKPVSKKARRASDGDGGTARIESPDLSADEGEDGGRSIGEGDHLHIGEGYDLHAGTDEGDDLHVGEGYDLHAGTGEGDLHAGTFEGDDLGQGVCSSEWMLQNGEEGPGLASEFCPRAEFEVPAQLGYIAGVDFDQLARDEKISRIRARLSEKEAALQLLVRLPL